MPSRAGSLYSGSLGRGASGHSRIGSSYRRNVYGRAPYPYGYYPYLGWYGWDFDSADDHARDSYADSYNQSGPVADSDDSGLRGDVQTLSGKIDRLQSDVEARNRPKPDEEPATALVFRDQHVEEVRNYAISGGVLWVLNQQAAKKIPLTDLDLDATARMNDDRGVDFQVPEPALSIRIVR